MPHHVPRASRVLAGFLLCLLLGSKAGATTFIVSNTADSGAGSLRQAIIDANNNGGIADTIVFDFSGTITLSSTLPPITDPAGLTIDGTGQTITISGNNSVQVMRVNIGAKLTLEHLTVINGRADGGGGIYNNQGTLIVSNSTFFGNNAYDYNGGGIYSYGTLIVSNSTFSNNSAYDYGGGIYSYGSFIVSNSTFSSNSSGYYGGGIYSYGAINVSNSSFSGNGTDHHGGGIYNYGSLSVSNSSFSGNSADDSGGGIYSNGSFSVSNSTFSSNSASTGGGIYNFGTYSANVSNSTFSGNNADSGGGILNTSTLSVSNSTFSGNNADSGGGIYNTGTLNLSNTILANSASGGDCDNDGSAINAFGVNLVQTGDCAISDALIADPQLGPLADNGGLTQTMALLAGSPAIDAADNAICAAPPINNLDQRGVTRPYGSSCDIGAYESEDDPSVPTATVIPTLSVWALMLLNTLVITTFQYKNCQKFATISPRT